MVGSSMDAVKPPIKFLCSYGGTIRPRYPDGKLRYHGGHTRVLAVDRSISFSDLLVKLGEMCGASASVRCQLPTEDLDALVSITSDEDLANIIEEYDRASSISSSSLKIRAFLSPLKSTKRISPPLSKSSSYSAAAAASSSRSRIVAPDRCLRQISPPSSSVHPFCFDKFAGKVPPSVYHAHGNPSQVYLINNGNHWQ